MGGLVVSRCIDMQPKLSHPPINELIIGVYFNPPLLDIHAHHIGIFWEKIRGRYPTVEQRDPIGNLYIDVAKELFPMPRYWLTSADGSHLVQIQRNAFLLNWRKREAAYPSYASVKAEFDDLYAQFSDFVRTINSDAPLTVDRAELSYINQITATQYWAGPADTSAVIPSYHPLGALVPTSINMQQSSRHDEKTTVSLSIRTTARKPDKVPVLTFEIRAMGMLGSVSKSAADLWFEAAHEMTGKTFGAVTSEDVRNNYWNRAVNDVGSR